MLDLTKGPQERQSVWVPPEANENWSYREGGERYEVGKYSRQSAFGVNSTGGGAAVTAVREGDSGPGQGVGTTL